MNGSTKVLFDDIAGKLVLNLLGNKLASLEGAWGLAQWCRLT